MSAYELFLKKATLKEREPECYDNSREAEKTAGVAGSTKS